MESSASCKCMESSASCKCKESSASCKCKESSASCKCVESSASCKCKESSASCKCKESSAIDLRGVKISSWGGGVVPTTLHENRPSVGIGVVEVQKLEVVCDF